MDLAIPSGENKVVLIIDDGATIREMLSFVLTHAGYKVHAVTDGRRALEYLRTTNNLPSIILLDLLMPVMNGWQFREEQKHDPRLANIPVIILSAVDALENDDTLLEDVIYLTKPSTMDTLLNMIAIYCK